MHNEATRNNAAPNNLYQCHHIFPDDTRCGSPRMRDEQFCYYHHDSRRAILRPHERMARRSTFSLVTPSSPNAILESLGEVMTRIAANDIDARRAGLLLYALQLASTNLRSAQQSEEPDLKVHPDYWDEPVPDPVQQR
jgi:hypothetical protein